MRCYSLEDECGSSERNSRLKERDRSTLTVQLFESCFIMKFTLAGSREDNFVADALDATAEGLADFLEALLQVVCQLDGVDSIDEVLCFSCLFEHFGSKFGAAKDWDLVEGLNVGDALKGRQLLL